MPSAAAQVPMLWLLSLVVSWTPPLSLVPILVPSYHPPHTQVVLDVGAGTGILSFFAAQAGAAKVYAVEASNMASHCMELVRSNKMESIITVLSAKIEEVCVCGVCVVCVYMCMCVCVYVHAYMCVVVCCWNVADYRCEQGQAVFQCRLIFQRWLTP